MKRFKFVILFSLSFLIHRTANAQVFTIDFKSDINPIGFIKTEKTILLVTDTAFFELDKKAKMWKSIQFFKEKIKTATVSKNRIWIGSGKGLFYQDDKNPMTVWTGINEGKLDVLALKTHPLTQELLVSTADDGAFSLNDNALYKTLVAYIRAEDACSCGSYDWVGTNAGLLRIDKKGVIQTYVEEGVGGFEIPDNLVDRLYCPDGKHLLVVMGEALAYLEADEKKVSSHAEGFEFLGKRGNKIHDAVMTPEGDFLFLTQDGLILMRRDELAEQHEHGATIEVYSNAGKPKISKFKPPTLPNDVWLKGHFDNSGALWLASSKRFFKLSKKELKDLLK